MLAGCILATPDVIHGTSLAGRKSFAFVQRQTFTLQNKRNPLSLYQLFPGAADAGVGVPGFAAIPEPAGVDAAVLGSDFVSNSSFSIQSIDGV